MNKKQFIEVLADIIKKEMNEKGFEFCIDYDSNQSLLIKFGRKVANKFYKNYGTYLEQNKIIEEGFAETKRIKF